MQVSEARIAANRANGAKSRGPLTPETRAISARNSLKHGLSGEGIVVPEGDRAEIDRRIEDFTADMKPISAAGVILIAQMATLSVRAERATEQEFAAIAHRVRHAADVFDEERIEQAEALFRALADNPRNSLRKLRKSPEGVERLVDAWHELRDDLAIEPGSEWTAAHLERAGYLLGLKAQHARGSRIGALSRAVWGDFSALTVADGAGLADSARKGWALAALSEAIDAEVAALEAHHQSLDFETIELDRAEAGERALFDTSKAATLARRYASEANRGFFKALKEFRIVEAEAAANLKAISAPPKAPEPRRPEPKVGSTREIPPPPPLEPARTPAEPRPTGNPTPMNPQGQPSRPDRPSKTPG